jgi:hypothetical protein
MNSLTAWLLSFTPFLVAAENLAEDEQKTIELWLTGMTVLVILLVAGLLLFALAFRHYAKHSTRPCQWCMEFIPKKAAVCPHCGKDVALTQENKA